MDRSVRSAIVLIAFLAGCSGAPVEDGVFFPTWDAEGALPTAIVQGTLVETDDCVFLQAHGDLVLVVWEDGMGFMNGTLLDGSGDPVAKVGEVLHGGGGYGDDRAHIEKLSGEAIPDRCIPDGDADEPFAIIYDVEPGTFD